MKKDTALTVVKITAAAALFLTAVLNFKKLSNLDIRILVAGASTLLAAELIVIGVYALKAVLFVIPASFLYISVGMAFDWKRALAVNMAGIAVEVTITYFLGKFLGKSAVEKKLQGTKAGEKLMNSRHRSQSQAVFIMRLVPVFPIDLTSLFMGAFDFKFLPYLLLSLAGIAPRIILSTILGDRIYDLIPMKYIIIAVIAAIPVLVIAGVIKKYRKGKKSASSEEADASSEEQNGGNSSTD